MKIYSKIISMMLSLVLLVGTISFSYAEVEYESITVDDYIMTTIVKNKDYEKFLFKNMNTNEVQYLEYYSNERGLDKYVVLDKDNKTVATIESKEEEILIKDQHNNIFDKINISNDSSLDYIPFSEWSDDKTMKGSRNTDTGNVLIVYGIIATLVGAPGGVTAILTVASFIANNNIPNVWYKGWYRTKWEDGLYYKHTYLKLYKNSNYTGYIDWVEYTEFH